MSTDFSVIIPAFNAAEWLGDAIQSVRLQSYADLEVIIVDDGSTDETSLVAFNAASEDSRIVVVENEHQGLSVARNTGIRKASGNWLIFLDADDYLEKAALGVIVATRKETGADLITFRTEPFLGHHEPTDQKSRFDKLQRYYGEWMPEITSTGESVFEELVKRNIFRPSACLYAVAREVVLVNELQFPKNFELEDNYFTPLVFLAAGRITVTNNLLHRRRVHGASLTAHAAPSQYLHRLIIVFILLRTVLRSRVRPKNLSFFFFFTLRTSIKTAGRFFGLLICSFCRRPHSPDFSMARNG